MQKFIVLTTTAIALGAVTIAYSHSLSRLLTTNQASVTQSPEQRGCCSHHKGVCGCDKGRVRCCDGTFSPTCTC